MCGQQIWVSIGSARADGAEPRVRAVLRFTLITTSQRDDWISPVLQPGNERHKDGRAIQKGAARSKHRAEVGKSHLRAILDGQNRKVCSNQTKALRSSDASMFCFRE